MADGAGSIRGEGAYAPGPSKDEGFRDFDHAMSGCPIHSKDESPSSNRPSSNRPSSVRWDLIFLGLAAGMLTLTLAVALQLP